jgi:hypothetical protein
MHEALKKNFDWIVPENPFDESSETKSVHRGLIAIDGAVNDRPVGKPQEKV